MIHDQRSDSAARAAKARRRSVRDPQIVLYIERTVEIVARAAWTDATRVDRAIDSIVVDVADRRACVVRASGLAQADRVVVSVVPENVVIDVGVIFLEDVDAR